MNSNSLITFYSEKHEFKVLTLVFCKFFSFDHGEHSLPYDNWRARVFVLTHPKATTSSGGYRGGIRGARPLIFRPNWGPKGRKIFFFVFFFFETRHPPYHRVWMTAPLLIRLSGSATDQFPLPIAKCFTYLHLNIRLASLNIWRLKVAVSSKKRYQCDSSFHFCLRSVEKETIFYRTVNDFLLKVDPNLARTLYW